MTQIYTLNTDNMHRGTSVESHKPDCAHLAQMRKHPWFEEGWIEEFSTPLEIFRDYNTDFYEEYDPETDLNPCWPITVYPCTGLVKVKTTVTEWGED